MQAARFGASILLLGMAFGPGAAATEDDWTACAAAIAVAEVEARLPGGLLGAIARTESGRRDPATGRVEPWPWALNVEGAGFHAASRAEGLASIRAWRARGSRSIDVGCLQVNLLHHPAAFATLEEALDPLANARYAARFLAALQQRAGGDWGLATARYHSATPDRGDAYRQRVQIQLAGGTMPAAPAGGAMAPGWALPVFTPQAIAAPRLLGQPIAPAFPAGRGLPRVFTPSRR
ncbi:transglycosylase SLT domain-containing protein [Paeniroseomonas aquatica]|uniref:Transglycosylase SLT domain-containing protein n=1 Tax=Paeniroseomonas aquatica TaxID=373043 RepID=A0ABT8AF49_9PROT|nr:transglycosylase SLT domain-containing protein [Paeniroseomonas aquatica]MDN3568401.1 transglycosylase SLT domain-containing protein [Paeniroseomonas aquatica]